MVQCTVSPHVGILGNDIQTFRLHCKCSVILCTPRRAVKRYIRCWTPHPKGPGKPKDATSGNQALNGAQMTNHNSDLTNYGDHKPAKSDVHLCESQVANSISNELSTGVDDNHHR